MITHADKTQEKQNRTATTTALNRETSGMSTFYFVDNRPEAIQMRKQQETANNSPQVKRLIAFQELANNSSQAKRSTQSLEMDGNYSEQQQQPIQKKENNTSMPVSLKSGMENLSGMSLDDVRVHRNSDKPAQLQAHAYAQGADIYLGHGQEKHLPHEVWHVVQQKQGRVKPTMQMKGNVSVNNDAGLEKEADTMGVKALQMTFQKNTEQKAIIHTADAVQKKEIIQRVTFTKGDHVVVNFGPYKFNALLLSINGLVMMVKALDGPLKGQELGAHETQVSTFEVNDIVNTKFGTKARISGIYGDKLGFRYQSGDGEFNGPVIVLGKNDYMGGQVSLVLKTFVSRSQKNYMSGDFENELAWSAEHDNLGFYSTPLPKRIENPLPIGQLLYRGDSRLPRSVFVDGFSPRNKLIPPSFRPGTADIDQETAISGTLNPRLAALFPIPDIGSSWSPTTFVYVCVPATVFHTYKIQREIAKGIRRGWLDGNKESHVNLAMKASNLATANEVTARSIDGKVVIGAFPVDRAQNQEAESKSDWKSGYTYTVGNFIINDKAEQAITAEQALTIKREIGSKSPVYKNISRYTSEYIKRGVNVEKYKDRLSQMVN